MESSDQLPQNWQKYIDPSSGEAYYVNKETNESQWEKPGGDDAGQWEEPGGKVYFANKETAEMQNMTLVNPMNGVERTFEIEKPRGQKRGTRHTRNSWSVPNDDSVLKKSSSTGGKMVVKLRTKCSKRAMIGAGGCCLLLVCLTILLALLAGRAGERREKKGLAGAGQTTTSAPAIPAVANPTRLVGQELNLVGLSLQQVQDGLPGIRVGIAKSLSVANDDVIVVSVTAGSSRRRRRTLGGQKVDILYKVKVADDAAVALLKAKMNSNDTQMTIKREIVQAIPSARIEDVSISSSAPTSEVYAPPTKNFDWRDCGNATVPLNQPLGYPKDVSPGLVTLPRSGEHVILTLKRILERDCSTTSVARSYDGNVWEGTYPHPHDPKECDTGTKSCTIETSNIGVAYRIDAYSLTADEVRTSNETISRLLLQATYGPSEDSIADFVASHGTTVNGATLTSFLNTQMNVIPSTLLREYYRKRTNPRTPVANSAGIARPLCEGGSRFHRFAFNQLDLQKTLNVSSSAVSGKFELSIDGVLRTEVDSLTTGKGAITTGSGYVICKVEEWTGTGRVAFYEEGKCGTNTLYLRNPIINFTNPDFGITQLFDQVNDVDVHDLNLPSEDAIIVERYNAACNDRQVHGNSFIKLAGRSGEKTWYKHDPRLRLIDNSLKTPANVSAFEDTASTCPSVPKSFLNRGSCVRLSSACSPLKFTNGWLPLNSSNLRLWYTANQKHVHYLTGLRLENPYHKHLCKISTYTRWKKVNVGGCVGGITETLQGTETLNTIVNLLNNSLDANPYVRDIEVGNEPCNDTLQIENDGVGVKVEAGGLCWQRVHEHEYNVYDFTLWTIQHDGNKVAKQAGRPNPITKFALDGRVDFVYPGWHPMQRWKDKVNRFIQFVGRYGDSVNFENLNSEVQTYELAEMANAVAGGASDGFESCGSRGEIRNEEKYGHLYRFPSKRLDLGIDANNELDFPYYRTEGKHMVWLNVALKSPDQLRQKVAWALSQILVIGESGLSGKEDEIENWLIYYDNFVRNAFGSYRTILKEVSYSPMMGSYLTYTQNKAYKFSKTFPDENYAREIMQLFTVGLWKLNVDGTYKLDADGNKQETYTNDDIVSFARIWTGFDRVLQRSNVEHQVGVNSKNFFDPMQIKPDWRDSLPKRALDKGFIGDGYPLCSDLPKLEFLAPGAEYINTGTKSDEGEWSDRDPDVRGSRQQFTVSNAGNSDLFNKLCGPKAADGGCTFPDKITLGDALQCAGDECKADFIRVVKVVDSVSDRTNYYTYHRPPCVRLMFFEDGRVTVDRRSLGSQSKLHTAYQCANPNTKSAGAACCDNGNVKNLPYARTGALSACNFELEFMSYNTSRSRCEKLGWQVCETVGGSTSDYKSRITSCGLYMHSWTSASCNYQVQVLSSGYLNVVDVQRHRTEYALDNKNFMLVRWKNNEFPTLTPTCGAGCTAEGQSCLCNITVINSVGIQSSTAGALPSVIEIEEKLNIGAYSPEGVYNKIDAGTYSECTTGPCNTHYQTHKVRVYLLSGTGSGQFDENTIFEIPPKYPGEAARFFINKASVVKVGQQYQFRNPPNFMPGLGEMYQYRGAGFSSKFHISEAAHEVDALLDHVFEHPNTAPFVSHRLIQRLVSSNPSPRYVKAVATAFINGNTSDGNVYSGKYGDIGAAVAEILIDQEARSQTLDVDPFAGKLREPILKVVHFLKAMKYKSKDRREINLYGMDAKVGQASFASPTVFNFFLPEFVPPGPIHKANLVSPESQLSTTPLLIGFLNGMDSLIQYGLTNCGYGFGDFIARPSRSCNSNNKAATTADGTIQFSPSENDVDAVINQIDLLLTSGRLNQNDWSALKAVYTKESNAEDALKEALRLLILTSEFHTTVLNRLKPTARSVPQPTVSQGRQYKAIVVLFLAGAADSFNMIVPHSECGGTHDLHQEYLDVRTNVALEKSSLLEINVPHQPCNKFGIHPSLPILKQQYDAGNASFIANMGALVEPITKAEYKAKSKRVPPSLFAHNIMQRAMHTVHAQVASSNGVLGRMVKVVSKEQRDDSNNVVPAYSSNMYSLNGNQRMLEGAAPEHIPFIIDKRNGIIKFRKYNVMSSDIENVTKLESENVFTETYSSGLENSLRQTEHLGELLGGVTLDTTFGDTDDVSRQLNQVSRLIKLRKSLNSERDVFIITHGGYDTHNDDGDIFQGKLDQINAGLTSFVAEMKAQNIFENTVLVSTSDFGRTLTSNGQGTDHAWGGNYFVLGGGVKGSKFLGQYPEKLGSDSSLNIGRGRILPTTSWEAMWNGLAEWFGVVPSKIDEVLPNKQNFPNNHMFTREQMFSN
eukprot:g2536.t1